MRRDSAGAVGAVSGDSASAGRGRRALVTRLSGFATATLINGAVGFLSIPVLIAAGGPGMWSVLTLGQVVGGVGMVLIGWGWNISGTAEAALLDRAGAQRLLLRSIAIRSKLVVPVAGVAAAVAFALAPSDRGLAAAGAASYALNGLTAAWFYTGMRAPRAFLTQEVLPRNAALVTGLVVSLFTESLASFPAFLAAGCLLAVALNVRGAGASLRDLPVHGRGALFELRRQVPALVTTLTSTAYLSTPILLVGTIAPRDLAAYALADRLFRTANVAASPILNVLQGAIPSNDPEVFRRRVARGLRGVLLLGIVAGLAFALLGPPLGLLLSGGATAVPMPMTAFYGVTLVATYVSQIVGLSCLVVLGRVRAVAMSATFGAALGVPLLVVGTVLLGGVGAAIGLAAAELAVTAYQLRELRRGLEAGR